MKFLLEFVLIGGCFAYPLFDGLIHPILHILKGESYREREDYDECVTTTTPRPSYIKHRVAIKKIDFAFTCEEHREKAIASGDFIDGNSYLLDICPYYHSNGSLRLFVTTPGYTKPGSPASLSVIDFANPSVLMPYPNWSYFGNATSCRPNRIVAAARLKVSICKLILENPLLGIFFQRFPNRFPFFPLDSR